MKTQLLQLLLFVILCSREAPAQMTGERTLLVLGDSIAAGYGLSPEESFPALIQEKCDEAQVNVRVINAGLSGDTTAGGLRRIEWLLRRTPDVVLLELGANDALRGLSIGEAKRNLRGTIAKIRAKNPKCIVVLAGMKAPPNFGSAFTDQFQSLYQELSTELGLALIPFILDGVAGVPQLNQGDGIHPTAEGQRIVAENAWKILKPFLMSPAAESPR